MMQRPPSTRWPAAVILLHWAMAALLLAMVGGGLVMASSAEHAAQTGDWDARVLGLPIFDAFQLHKSVGVTLWILVVSRVVTRMFTQTPRLPSTLSRFDLFAAKTVQVGLYGLMFSMPITGWLVASASPLGLPTRVFDLFTLPHAPVNGDVWETASGSLHWVGGWALLGLASLHIAAALKHHFIDRDDVLKAMLPAGPRFVSGPRKETKDVS